MTTTVPNAGNLLPAVPPEWLTLQQALMWIEIIHRVPSEIVGSELILATRNRSVKHRIPNIQRTHNRSVDLPPGLAGAVHPGAPIFVRNWEAAETDWPSATVGGWQLPDRTRERVPIEVSWLEIELFVSIRLPRWKKAASIRDAQIAPHILETCEDIQPTASVSKVSATMGQEARLRKFLIEEMSKAPCEPRSKAIMKREAEANGYDCSGRGFERAWQRAVDTSKAFEWRAPGPRKRDSNHRT